MTAGIFHVGYPKVPRAHRPFLPACEMCHYEACTARCHVRACGPQKQLKATSSLNAGIRDHNYSHQLKRKGEAKPRKHKTTTRGTRMTSKQRAREPDNTTATPTNHIKSPTANHHRPTIKEKPLRPVIAHPPLTIIDYPQRPSTNDQSSSTHHQSSSIIKHPPIIIIDHQQLPIINDHSPSTNHQVPTTNHQSPTIKASNKNSKPQSLDPLRHDNMPVLAHGRYCVRSLVVAHANQRRPRG